MELSRAEKIQIKNMLEDRSAISTNSFWKPKAVIQGNSKTALPESLKTFTKKSVFWTKSLQQSMTSDERINSQELIADVDAVAHELERR